jgi:metal-responsive CopG/Arc/MetJ family transcriptional regulator
MGSPIVSRKAAPARSTTKRQAPAPKAAAKPAKERVLIEFPAEALRRADAAARAAGVSRSEFIRSAVEQRLEAIAEAEFDRELAAACIANSQRNLEMLKEFEHVDREAWEALP